MLEAQRSVAAAAATAVAEPYSVLRLLFFFSQLYASPSRARNPAEPQQPSQHKHEMFCLRFGVGYKTNLECRATQLAFRSLLRKAK